MAKINKTKNYTYSMTDKAREMLEEIFTSGSFSSMSETLRYCIQTTHKRQFPYYKVAGEEKKAEEVKEQAIKEKYKAMEPEEYASEVLGADSIEVKEGIKKAVLVHKTLGREVKIDLAYIKQYTDRNQVFEVAKMPPEDESA